MNQYSVDFGRKVFPDSAEVAKVEYCSFASGIDLCLH